MNFDKDPDFETTSEHPICSPPLLLPPLSNRGRYQNGRNFHGNSNYNNYHRQHRPFRQPSDFSANQSKYYFGNHFEDYGWQSGTQKNLKRTMPDLVAPPPPPSKRERIDASYSSSVKIERNLPSGSPSVITVSNPTSIQNPQWLEKTSEVDASALLTDNGLELDIFSDIEKKALKSRWISKYSDSKLVNQLTELKLQLTDQSKLALTTARSKANPYESIGKNIFCTRAAVKMAELDTYCQLLVREDVLKFADICCDRGGFSEYILWRRKQRNRRSLGLGITLKGDDELQIDKWRSECRIDEFEAFYGPLENGDILEPQNRQAFIAKLNEHRKVHLILADGAIEIVGDDENFQEEKSSLIFLAQILIAFQTLSPGGNFIMKIFDILTPLTMELLYVTFCHFARVTILKPFSSRPSNSERYVLFQKFVATPHSIVLSHLEQCCQQLHDLDKSTLHQRVIRLFPTLSLPISFIKYIKASNIELAAKQISGLENLIKYLYEPSTDSVNDFEKQIGKDDIEDQEEKRRLCLEAWSLPDDRQI